MITVDLFMRLFTTSFVTKYIAYRTFKTVTHWGIYKNYKKICILIYKFIILLKKGQKMYKIKCLKYHKVDKGFLEGTVDIFVENWGIEILDIKIFKKDSSKWLSFPARVYEVNGKKCFAPYIKMPLKEDMTAFCQAVLHAIQNFEAEPLSLQPHFQEEEFLPF
jgi:hypothetical protein